MAMKLPHLLSTKRLVVRKEAKATNRSMLYKPCTSDSQALTVKSLLFLLRRPWKPREGVIR
jgi:hypothetical protein